MPPSALQAMAGEFGTCTDCMSSHVQSSLLRKEVLRRLKPEFLNTGLLYEVRPLPPAALATAGSPDH